MINAAKFNAPSASMEDIEYHPDRNLGKQLIIELRTCNYIKEYHNIILMGASSNGKTWVSNALVIQALRQFHKVRYIHLPTLLDELVVVKNAVDGSFRKIIERYQKIELLILDE